MIRSYNNLACCFIVINLIFVCLYSPFIIEINVLHVLSAVFTVTISFIAILVVLYRGYINKYELLLFVIVLTTLVQAILYFFKGVSANELVRSYLPFLYLPVFSLLGIRLSSNNTDLILKCIMVIGIIVSLLVIPFFVELFILNSLTFNRYTAYLDLTHTPIMIMTVPLLYLFSIKYRYLLLLIVFIAVFATQSKGQILFAVGALLFCELVGRKVNSKMIIKIIMLIMILAAPLIIFKDTITKRFIDITGSTSSHRVEEIIVATGYIVSNPLLGGGPGITFRISDSDVASEDSEEQRYIHNIILYLLATGGVFGAFIYLLPYFPLLKNFRSSNKAKYITISVLFAFLYLLVSATFKSIQTNMFMGILIGACLQLKAKKTHSNE